MRRHQLTFRDHKIRQCEQTEQELRSVLGQTLLAKLAMTKQVLHDINWDPDPRADLCLSVFEQNHQFFQRIFLHRFDFSAFRHLRLPRRALHLGAFVYTKTDRVSEHFFSGPVQRDVGLQQIQQVRWRVHHDFHQSNIGVDSHEAFTSKRHSFSFLRLMHFRGATLLSVLGRRWLFDDRRMDQRALLHHLPAVSQREADLVEQLARKLMRDQQSQEVQLRDRGGRLLNFQINAVRAHCNAVIQRVFQCFIEQSVPLPKEVDSQHSLNINWRTASLALRVVPLNERQQPRPWDDFFHLGEKASTFGHTFLACTFSFRESDLPFL